MRECSIKAAMPVEAFREPSLTTMHWWFQIAVIIEGKLAGRSTKSKAHCWDGGSVSKIERRFGIWVVEGPIIAWMGGGNGLKWIITAY